MVRGAAVQSLGVSVVGLLDGEDEASVTRPNEQGSALEAGRHETLQGFEVISVH